MSVTIDITTSSVIGQSQSRTVKFTNASFSTEEAGFMSALSKNTNEFVNGYGKDEEEAKK